jgi:hypothetical protein
VADDAPVTFLTPDWFAALERAAEAAGDLAAVADEGVVVRHEVTGCPPDGRTVSFVVRGTAAGTTVRQVPSGEPHGGPDPPGPADSAGRADRADAADDADVDVAEATVSFHAAYESARAVLAGEANAQQLLLDGRLHVRGDLDALVRHAPWFEALARAWAPVRARTR